MSYAGSENGRLRLCKFGGDRRNRLEFKVCTHFTVTIYLTNTISDVRRNPTVSVYGTEKSAAPRALKDT